MSSKRRPGFDHSILGETGAGEQLNRAPPLVVVYAGAESYSAVLRWKKVGELNGRQDEHNRLQHLLMMRSAGTDYRGQWGSRRRSVMQGGGGGCNVQYRGDAFPGCDVFWFGRGGGGACAFLFRGREGAGHTVL